MKVDKIISQYKDTIPIKNDKNITPFGDINYDETIQEALKDASTDVEVNNSLSKIKLNDMVDISIQNGKIVETIKIDSVESPKDQILLKLMDNIIKDQPQLKGESIHIMDDNSLDIVLKDGNTISIKNMDKFLSVEDFQGNKNTDHPIKELNIKVFNQWDSFILVNGKEAYVNGKEAYVNGKEAYVNGKEAYVNGKGALVNGKEAYVNGKGALVNGKDAYVNGKDAYKEGELVSNTFKPNQPNQPNQPQQINSAINYKFIALAEQGKSMIIYIPTLGYVYLDDETFKKIVYHLPYLSVLQGYNVSFYFANLFKRYSWKTIVILIALFIALIKMIFS